LANGSEIAAELTELQKFLEVFNFWVFLKKRIDFFLKMKLGFFEKSQK